MESIHKFYIITFKHYVLFSCNITDIFLGGGYDLKMLKVSKYDIKLSLFYSNTVNEYEVIMLCFAIDDIFTQQF